MAKNFDDDLFKETTMTFGEHLEELRVRLFRAVLGLVIGTAIGLYVGEYFVRMIATPLEGALKVYYQTQAEIDYQAWSTDRSERGLSVPYSIDEVRAIASNKDRPGESELIYEVRLTHPETLNASPTVAPQVKAESKPEQSNSSDASPAADPQLASQQNSSKFNRENLVPVLLWYPLDKDHRVMAQGLGPAEAFSIWIKACLIVGAVLSSPWVFYQIWLFVAAGLYPHERKYVYVFLPISLGLFFLGVAIAFLFVFDPVLNFLFSFNRSMGINPDPRISEWLGFVLLLPLGFGISFQLPLVMLFLNRIGVFDVRAYVEKWRVAVLVIFILSAVLTPADPYSMLLMALPLTVLYFGGVLLCRYLPKIGV